MGLPSLASSLATRLATTGHALSDAEKVTGLATRLEQLSAKSTLTAAERAEKSELSKAVTELKEQGWLTKETRAAPDRNGSSFAEGKAKGKGSTVTGLIDAAQNWVDGATLAGGLAGAGLTATVAGAPAGVVTTLVADAAGLVNAGVDVVQAGVAAAQGDFAEAGTQLLEAGGRALGAIPYVGTALRGAKVAKAGVQVAEKVAVQVGEKAALKAGATAAKVSTEAVEAFVKDTAGHPALTDLAYTLGAKFKGATLHSIADASGVEQLTVLAEKIRKGDTAGTTLARYAKGEGGVNDFLHDVVGRFAKSSSTKLNASAIGELGESTVKLLGKPGAELAKSVDAALATGKLATKHLDAVRRGAELLDGTGNAVVRQGITNAMKTALESANPGKALQTLVDKATLIEKTAVKAGGGSTSLTTLLSQASHDTQQFRQTFETLLDSRISLEGLQRALTPERLAKMTDKAGFDQLVSEARRLSF